MTVNEQSDEKQIKTYYTIVDADGIVCLADIVYFGKVLAGQRP